MSCSILLYNIKFDLDYSVSEIVNKIENDNLDETRIIIDNYDDTSLTGMYIYTEIYKAKEYNFESNSFELIIRRKHVVTEFHIDLLNNYMDIWGTIKNAQKIITALSLAFDNHVVIEAMEVKFSKMVDYLSTKENIFVGKVTARQVVMNDGLLADCSFDLSHKEKPFEVIGRYMKNIQRISFKWKSAEAYISMVIYMSGLIIVYKARHLISEKELNDIYEMMLYAGR